MKQSAEYKRFTALVDRVLAVPHSVIKQRVEEHRTRAPSYRENVLKEEELIASLLRKLGPPAG